MKQELEKEIPEYMKPIVAHVVGIIVMKKVSEELESLKGELKNEN